jgi:hypothetical protein
MDLSTHADLDSVDCIAKLFLQELEFQSWDELKKYLVTDDMFSNAIIFLYKLVVFFSEAIRITQKKQKIIKYWNDRFSQYIKWGTVGPSTVVSELNLSHEERKEIVHRLNKIAHNILVPNNQMKVVSDNVRKEIDYFVYRAFVVGNVQ